MFSVGILCTYDGFRAFAEKRRISENIYFADIICHGVPSPGFFKAYIDEYCDNLTEITFKNKQNGWERPKAAAETPNGPVSLQPYVDIFNQNYNLRPSCYRCPYATIHRNSDITIGDYWGIQKAHPEFYNKMGVSLILVHTEHGKELIEKISKEMKIIKSNVSACLQPNLQHPTTEPKNRSKFWSLYKNKGIVAVVRKYSYVGIKNKLKRKLYDKLRRN